VKATLWATTAVVGAATLVCPFLSGYGTVLGQIVGLGGYILLEALLTTEMAEKHIPLIWVVAIVINVGLYFVPALELLHATRKRWPTACVTLLIAWCLFYLACLFVLFPATDGP
jgi:hypothetical protein